MEVKFWFGNRISDAREVEKYHGIALVIEFESIETARKFYESEKYQAAKAVREMAAWIPTLYLWLIGLEAVSK